MLTGVVSNENIAQVLRGISQKRKQGVLEITLGERSLQLLFVAGKIVDAYESVQQAMDDVIDSLAAARILPDGFSAHTESYAELFEALESSGCPLDREEFQVLVTQRALNRLYGLRIDAGAYYSFKVQMIEHDPELWPAISVGQLLLDFVALEDDEERFNEAFPPDYFVVVEGEIEALSIEEGFALHALEFCHYVAELRVASMLSEFHFREALFSLLNRGAIDVQAEQTGEGAESRSLDDIVATLQGSFEHELPVSELEAAFTESFLEEFEDSSDDGEAGEIAADMVEEVPYAVSFTGVLNARLLQESWVPGVLVLLFLVSALFAPVLAWDACIRAFSNF